MENINLESYITDEMRNQGNYKIKKSLKKLFILLMFMIKSDYEMDLHL